MSQLGSMDRVRIPKPAKHHTSARLPNNCTPISLVKTGYRIPEHLPGMPWDQHRFRAPPDSPLGGRTLPQSMMRSLRRPIGPHPPQSMPIFKWSHSLESETSMPLEEALVRGTSHVQCNHLMLQNTRL
ncbi:hypothetical protein M9H77_26183 [Catharanthus roseus]|uniref:Uncharacterized protein n=1 Tax=Catharanthus roseus TaxID=4058 RepID=A0ACC0AAG9_CATRO|nr:hypothetical protein M9H77_26183 [Catharanthus roseus]